MTKNTTTKTCKGTQCKRPFHAGKYAAGYKFAYTPEAAITVPSTLDTCAEQGFYEGQAEKLSDDLQG